MYELTMGQALLIVKCNGIRLDYAHGCVWREYLVRCGFSISDEGGC